MDRERLRDDEYEKQYYDFSSTELYEDFKLEVSKAIKMSLKELEAAIKDQRRDELLRDKKIVELYTCYMESAKLPLQKFKDEARKIFAIPKNVVLEEDRYNINQYSDADIIQLKQEVADLEKAFIQEKVFLEVCKKKREFADTIVRPMQEKINCIIKSLKNFSDNENERKMLELYEQQIQHYFNDGNTEVESPEILNVNRSFMKDTDNFFK